MKSNKGFRAAVSERDPGESQRKAVKLPPIKKSGKDRHALYSTLEEDDDLEIGYRKRESVLDYFDDVDEDGAQEEDLPEEEFEEEFEEVWDEEDEGGEEGEDGEQLEEEGDDGLA